jgi:hypothetical protein
MADIQLNSVTLATESGGTVTLDSGVQDGITRLGTVTAGSIAGGSITGATTFPTGMVIQSKMTRAATKSVLSSNSTPIEVSSDLRLTITPKFANSMLKMSWVISGEGANPNSYVWRVGKDGATSSAVLGYEPQLESGVWSGIYVGSSKSEVNDDSTPNTEGPFLFYVPAEDTSARYYTLTFATGNSSTYSYYLGRTIGGSGSSDHENAIAFGFIEEIAGPYGDINL